jgi:hypothetical protein
LAAVKKMNANGTTKMRPITTNDRTSIQMLASNFEAFIAQALAG